MSVEAAEGEQNLRLGVAEPSEDVADFVAARRTPRARARRKLEAVVQRLIDARAPADRARDLWVHGSYARGAPDVGDLDLFLRIDETRDRGRQALDSYYRRGHPYAEIVKALGCGGASIVNLHVEPIFAPALQPISPERCNDGIPPGHQVPVRPLLRHLITGDPFDPQPLPVWVRGDSIDQVRLRLAAIAQDANARRFERTTTVPLIDTLLPILGVETGFLLAAQIRAGNLDVGATVLTEAQAPPESRQMLAMRYRPGSERHRAAAAALAHLKTRGVGLERVQLAEEPVTSSARKPRLAVSFNTFLIYQTAASDLPDGWAHLHVWPTPRGGRWLALQVRVKNGAATHELHWQLNPRDPQADRYTPIRRALGMPPLTLANRGSSNHRGERTTAGGRSR